jgi:hypothetical protein
MSKYQICPECEGSGKDSNTAIALTMDDIYEYAGDDYDERMDYVRAIADLTAPCWFCEGRAVVTAEKMADYAEELQQQNLYLMEQRYGC